MPLRGGPIGGAPSRVPFTLPANRGPLTNPNATNLRPGIGALGAPSSVIDISCYPGGAQTLYFTLGLDGSGNPQDVLAINRPAAAQLRSVLVIRSDPGSTAGSVIYVAFGTQALPTTAWFSIPPGGIIYLDGRVPQDDVHVSGSANGVLAVLGYANYIVQPGT